MAIDATKISWVPYKSWEGPMWVGNKPAHLPYDAPMPMLYLKVISSTEGNLDAGQGWDICRMTFGFNQWCGLYPGMVRMLNAVQKARPGALDPLIKFTESIGVSLTGKDDYFLVKGQKMNTDPLLRQIFFAGGTGLKGTWTSEQRNRVIGWVVAFANCHWEDPEAAGAQINYAASTVLGFVNQEARWLFDKSLDLSAPGETKAIVNTLRAAFLSFAANNPTRASTYLNQTRAKTSLAAWTMPWLVEMLRGLTWDPQVDIHPARYNAIRPVLERAFGLDLPDFADELRKAREAGQEPMSVLAIQQRLIDLGYDVGPTGADGKWGKRSEQAVKDFQKDKGLTVDGIVGPKTRAALLA